MAYSNIIKDSIKNIKRTKNNKLIYHDKVKMALFKREKDFYETKEKLKSLCSMNIL